MAEIWRPCQNGFVSNLGFCRTLDGRVTRGYLCGQYYRFGGYPVHRLVLEHFRFNRNPEYFTYGDHKNRNPKDNRLVNLRHSTPTLNNLNRDAKGVTFYKDRNKYHTQIKLFGKNHHIGFYNSEEEALIISAIVYKLAYLYIEGKMLTENCAELTQLLQLIKVYSNVIIFFKNLI